MLDRWGSRGSGVGVEWPQVTESWYRDEAALDPTRAGCRFFLKAQPIGGVWPGFAIEVARETGESIGPADPGCVGPQDTHSVLGVRLPCGEKRTRRGEDAAHGQEVRVPAPAPGREQPCFPGRKPPLVPASLLQAPGFPGHLWEKKSSSVSSSVWQPGGGDCCLSVSKSPLGTGSAPSRWATHACRMNDSSWTFPSDLILRGLLAGRLRLVISENKMKTCPWQSSLASDRCLGPQQSPRASVSIAAKWGGFRACPPGGLEI